MEGAAGRTGRSGTPVKSSRPCVGAPATTGAPEGTHLACTYPWMDGRDAAGQPGTSATLEVAALASPGAGAPTMERPVKPRLAVRAAPRPGAVASAWPQASRQTALQPRCLALAVAPSHSHRGRTACGCNGLRAWPGTSSACRCRQSTITPPFGYRMIVNGRSRYGTVARRPLLTLRTHHLFSHNKANSANHAQEPWLHPLTSTPVSDIYRVHFMLLLHSFTNRSTLRVPSSCVSNSNAPSIAPSRRSPTVYAPLGKGRAIYLPRASPTPHRRSKVAWRVCCRISEMETRARIAMPSSVNHTARNASMKESMTPSYQPSGSDLSASSELRMR